MAKAHNADIVVPFGLIAFLLRLRGVLRGDGTDRRILQTCSWRIPRDYLPCTARKSLAPAWRPVCPPPTSLRGTSSGRGRPRRLSATPVALQPSGVAACSIRVIV